MAAEHFTAVTDATFGLEVEQHQGLTIVDFWATWCCSTSNPNVASVTEIGRAHV